MIESNLMDWQTLVKRMSIAPAEIAGYANQGRKIEVGAPANMILVDPSAKWQVRRDRLNSKSKNTPFDGMELPAVITDVIYSGKRTVIDGKVVNG
jgi:dihydroorotase